MSKFKVLKMDKIIIPKEFHVHAFNQLQKLRGKLGSTTVNLFCSGDMGALPGALVRYKHSNPDKYAFGDPAIVPPTVALFELLNTCPWKFSIDNSGNLELADFAPISRSLFYQLWIIYELAPYLKKANRDPSCHPQTSEIEIINTETYQRFMVMILEPSEDENAKRNDRTKMVRIIEANCVYDFRVSNSEIKIVAPPWTGEEE